MGTSRPPSADMTLLFLRDHPRFWIEVSQSCSFCDFTTAILIFVFPLDRAPVHSPLRSSPFSSYRAVRQPANYSANTKKILHVSGSNAIRAYRRTRNSIFGTRSARLWIGDMRFGRSLALVLVCRLRASTVSGGRAFKNSGTMIAHSASSALLSFPDFLPQIVASLGYSTVKTNLYTVAPNVAGTVMLIILTQSSDRCRERSLHICVALIVGLVGWIMLGSINPLDHKGAAYAACFFIAMGASAPSVLTATWYSNNTPGESRRVVLAAVMIAIANSAGLVSSNVFRPQDEPRYLPALGTSAGFAGLCLLTVLVWGMYMRWDNRRRDRAQGVRLRAEDVDTAILAQGWKHPSFRWMY